MWATNADNYQHFQLLTLAKIFINHNFVIIVSNSIHVMSISVGKGKTEGTPSMRINELMQLNNSQTINIFYETTKKKLILALIINKMRSFNQPTLNNCYYEKLQKKSFLKKIIIIIHNGNHNNVHSDYK